MIRGKKISFPEVRITEDMINRAGVKGQKMGTLKNSITGGERNILSFIGEEVANVVIKGSIRNTYDYDIMVDGVTVDVKSKDTSVYPRGDYEVSVADYNTKQNCDYYVFVRVLDDLTIGWVLGCMPKEEYYRKARFLRQGQVDGSNGFIVRADCWNMYISDLYPIDKLIKRS